MKEERSFSAHLQNVEEIESRETEWVIPFWIPKGGITLLAGDGGIGKTNLWSYLVSCISAGKPTMLDNEEFTRPYHPGNVASLDPENGILYEHFSVRCLYFSKEDSTAKRLKKNFQLYEANLHDLHTIDVEHLTGFTFSVAELEDYLTDLRPALVVFDPVQAFFPAGASMTSRQQSRRTLDRLVQLAQQYNTAFLLICHTNKKSTDDWRQKITGSADLPDIARSVMFTGVAEIMAGHCMRYISQEKNSYAPLETTVLYTIGEDGKITYAGMSERRFAEYAVLKPYASRPEPPKTQRDLCRQVILDILREDGEMRIADLDESLLNAGFSAKVCKSAKSGLVAEGAVVRKKTKLDKGVE